LRSFRYVRPERLDEALALLEEYGSDAHVLAGGTDLIVRLRMGHLLPRVVIDLKRVTALGRGVVETDSCLRVGALTVMTDLIGDPRVQARFPALVEAARVVGSVQIRNRATLAGNICNASPAADTAPVLLVHGAVVNLAGRGGTRRVPLAEFFIGPGQTARARGEIVESIDLPLPSARCGAAFGRVTRRRGVDLATINLCCLVEESGRTRFGFGAAGPRPFLVEDETGVLADRSGAVREKEAAIDGLVAHASPITDLRGSREYRVAMLKVTCRRALEAALERLQHGS
jgi:carbon-monoxide dehydrogenase medium subunit